MRAKGVKIGYNRNERVKCVKIGYNRNERAKGVKEGRGTYEPRRTLGKGCAAPVGQRIAHARGERLPLAACTPRERRPHLSAL